MVTIKVLQITLNLFWFGLVWLMLSPSQQLWSCRDGQLYENSLGTLQMTITDSSVCRPINQFL